MDIYKTVAWGPAVGIGVSGTLFVHLSAVGKPNNPPNDPFTVANELVAAELGRLLRLPVPPGCVVLDASGAPHYASLDFNLTGNSLPPVIPAHFVAQLGEATAADIVVFDIFVANSDRHAGNLAADYSVLPARYSLFDHSHCLFGGSHHGTVGAARLGALSGALAITGPPFGNRHCLLDVIANDGLLRRMLERVESIPDYFIDSVAEATSEYGVTSGDAQNLAAFLKTRRTTITQLIQSHKAAFSGISQWSFL
jgi:hypothetical protein